MKMEHFQLNVVDFYDENHSSVTNTIISRCALSAQVYFFILMPYWFGNLSVDK